MPSATRRWLGIPSIDLPCSRIDPAVTGWTPDTVHSNVVLPAPLAPMRLTISPELTSSETPCSASIRPYALLRSSIESKGRLSQAMGPKICVDYCRIGPNLGRGAFGQGATVGE